MIGSWLHRIAYLVVLWGALSQRVWGQITDPGKPTMPSFRVDHISVNDGLTQGSVYYMLKDSRNFLWFGTQDGLNRYDGHRFRTYRSSIGEQGVPRSGAIRGGNVFGIVEDPDGNLWVGTEEGLNRYDRQRDRFDCFFTIDVTNRPRYSRTLPFFVDKTEVLYLSDAEGLVRFNYRTRQKTIIEPGVHPAKEYDLPSSTMRTMSGDIWLHAPTGLIRYNLHNRTFSHYFSNRSDNEFGDVKMVFSFFIDPENIAWIGTDAGLIRFDYQQRKAVVYDHLGNQPLRAVYSIAPDEYGRLWLGTQRNGLLYFDKRSRLFGQVNDLTDNTHKLSDFEIRKVYADKLGIVWANVDPDGLARVVPNAFLFGGVTKQQATNNIPPDQRLSNYTIRGFMEERFDRLWMVTDDGLNVLDPRTNRVVKRYLTDPKRYHLPTHKFVRCIYRDPQRRIWVGMRGGVMAFHPETEQFEPILFQTPVSQVTNNYVRNLTSINDSTLIAATEDGMYALNIIRRKWSKLPDLAGENIFNLWYDTSARQLWVGTFLNGYRCYQLPYNPLDRWRLVRSGLQGSMVLHVRPDTLRQTMWLATDRGLAALKIKTGEVKLYTDQQGLANSFVYGSLADVDNVVWLTTNRGISRLEPNTGAIKNFTLSDGLQGNEFNGNAFVRLASGELFFGGVNGFNRFLPDRYRNSSFSPTIHIYSLKVNEDSLSSDKYVGEIDQIELKHDQSTVSMEFAALDYFSDGHNQYQYQLTNYDEQWVAAGERNYVRYANLPPGKYVFQVKAANRDGHWSSRIKKLAIHIQPPFWQTIPFYVLAVLTIGLLIVGWILQRENAIRQQEAERLRLAYEIQEQVKKDIARDLHDEIGTRLATLKLYTTRLVQYVTEVPVETTRLEAQAEAGDGIPVLKDNIFSLINSTISDVRNLLRKLNPQTLERYGYVAAVEELFSRINATGTVAMCLTLADAPGEAVAEEADMVGAQRAKDESMQSTPRLAVDTEVMLYRITQELITNSLKHANAHQIDLVVQGQKDRVLLTYSDDGKGFDYDQVKRNGSGLGLGNIESRIAILSGKIVWQTQPGKGVSALIDVPTGPKPRGRWYRLMTRFYLFL